MNRQLEYLEENTRFIDGSEYRGTWNVLGMDGIGKFVLPNSTVFEGELRDGTFHGHGSMYWPRGQRMDGIWVQGECKEKRYTFDDGLTYSENDWKYCKFPDRRYLTTIRYKLKPAGATSRTNDRNDFIIPSTCYDSGIGIFNPHTYCITSYRHLNKVVEIPSTKMIRWITKNCQKGWSEPTGFRKHLYENWFSPTFDQKILSTFLPFTDDSFEPWWKRLTTFRRDCTLKQEKSENQCICFDKSQIIDENVTEFHPDKIETTNKEIISPTVSCY